MGEIKDKDNEKAVYGSVEFETEDGEIVTFYILEQTRLGGIDYILVTDDVEGTEDTEGGFLVLRENGVSGDEEDIVSYEIVEDEKELKAVVGVFNELLEDLDLEV